MTKALEKPPFLKSNGKRTTNQDGPAWTIQSCAEVLAPLLENDNSNTLAPSQLDAIRHLCFLSSSDSGHGESSKIVKHIQSNLNTLRDRRFRSKMAKFINDTLADCSAVGYGQKEKSQSESTYQDVLKTFGGQSAYRDAVQFQTRTNERKVIHLRKNRVSGVRINLLINDYKCGGTRDLSAGRVNQVWSHKYDLHQNCPPEWNALPAEAKTILAELLSWQNLSKWEFNIVEVANLTADPLLLVGWALLCEPMAQEAMNLSIGACVTKDAKSYDFSQFITIDPRAICNFLREIERKYKFENPYHNNIHAADVTQTTHCLFQLMDEKYLKRIWDPITIFSLLLSATFHDVGHPGTNNLFQEHAMTPLAIQYNDEAILENMHSAVGHNLLLGEDKREEWDIFANWAQSDKVNARKVMKASILGTDMSHHFTQVEELNSLIGKVRGEAEDISQDNTGADQLDNQDQPILSILAQNMESPDELEEYNLLVDLITKFLLHAADISNPAKTEDLVKYWADGALSEFFAQGDKEKEMGLPISPLCDRDTVKRQDSQIGFIKFVIQPSFDLLGEIIPGVKKVVVPRIEKSLEYWEREKLSMSMKGDM
mmetsp:Transcript_14204/g.30651  ORF Transcript_14204/g.30651 Transcript_14204/m.30651 type:complete len:598 (+) Transcript_14204:100-1893(+)